MNRSDDPIDLAGIRKIYFDTSSWNRLADHPRREELIHEMKRSGCIVLASVITVGEVLCVNDSARRQSICSVMSALHGDGHVLERPQDILAAAVERFTRGDKDMILPRTGPGEWLDHYVRNPVSPTSEDRQHIKDWLGEMERSLRDFLAEIRPPVRDRRTDYCSAGAMDREDFLRLLCNTPPARRFVISVQQMRDMCGQIDLWRAFSGTLACIIGLSASHAPNWKSGKKRPGGRDVWQLVYLGGVEMFVTEDVWMRHLVERVSACMRYPRGVGTLAELLKTPVGGESTS